MKERRLQDWGKSKKCVPVHKQADLSVSAQRGSQPFLKKAMQMLMMIQNKHDSTVQCHVCVHRPMCCTVLKNATAIPPPPPPQHF